MCNNNAKCFVESLHSYTLVVHRLCLLIEISWASAFKIVVHWLWQPRILKPRASLWHEWNLQVNVVIGWRNKWFAFDIFHCYNCYRNETERKNAFCCGHYFVFTNSWMFSFYALKANVLHRKFWTSGVS